MIMKKAEDLTEEEIAALLKLAEELAEVLKPYIDALEHTINAMMDFLVEYEKVAKS